MLQNKKKRKRTFVPPHPNILDEKRVNLGVKSRSGTEPWRVAVSSLPGKTAINSNI